ncbi:hypothetical protein AGMMS49545_16220 [Betaproteobacteria bacterium]|nr:hypothetical protein AGMMS49545_16220 [Betaproteobacteria bacterium]GHU42068.1 hypothetical protein AGMMS50289_06180 [Betaproteobacteria bacterium]
MELSRARCQDPAKIAELLGLDRELVLFIIASQLQPNGWMTNLGAVTGKGQSVLDEAQEIDEKVQIGYAYQDAISGNWLPRFTEILPEVEPDKVDAKGYPIFLRNRDSGKGDRPFRLNPVKHETLEADVDALFEAFKRYESDHAFAEQRDKSEGYVDEGNMPKRLNIKNFSFVHDTGQLMWIWTWVFPDAGAQPWLVADPFGLQAAVPWLRKPLQEILPINDGLARYLARMLGEANPEKLSAAEWLKNLESKVDMDLFANYPWTSKVPEIKNYLASVLRRSEQLRNQEQGQPEDISSLLIEIHNLVESVLQWMLKNYPPDIRRLPHWEDQPEWKEGQSLNYLQSFNLGCLTDNVAQVLSHQRLDQVRTAVKKRGSSSLKALLFAALLATVDKIRHPLSSLSANELQLDRLLEMTDARNKKAGHAGGDKISKEEALKYADFISKWVQIFKEWY